MDKKLIYVSHSIRGKQGNKATPKSMEANCKKAKAFGEWLSKNFPEFIFYIPAMMDDFLIDVEISPLTIVDGLLALDCAIIGNSSGMIMFMPDNYISGGMMREYKYALSKGKQILKYDSDLNTNQTFYQVVMSIRNWLESL